MKKSNVSSNSSCFLSPSTWTVQFKRKTQAINEYMDTYVHTHFLKKSLNSFHCCSSSSAPEDVLCTCNCKALLPALLMTCYSLVYVECSRTKSSWPSEYLQVYTGKIAPSQWCPRPVFKVAPAVCFSGNWLTWWPPSLRHGEGDLTALLSSHVLSPFCLCRVWVGSQKSTRHSFGNRETTGMSSGPLGKNSMFLGIPNVLLFCHTIGKQKDPFPLQILISLKQSSVINRPQKSRTGFCVVAHRNATFVQMFWIQVDASRFSWFSRAVCSL